MHTSKLARNPKMIFCSSRWHPSLQSAKRDRQNASIGGVSRRFSTDVAPLGNDPAAELSRSPAGALHDPSALADTPMHRRQGTLRRLLGRRDL
jgi:hypothetical protein